MYNSLLADFGLLIQIEVTSFKEGSVIVQFIVYLESFEKPMTDVELENLMNQQLAGLNGPTMVGDFALDSEFTSFWGRYQTCSLG